MEIILYVAGRAHFEGEIRQKHIRINALKETGYWLKTVFHGTGIAQMYICMI
jgi:hypothetical protein